MRRVNFNGTSGVNDEVFRREMRQLEGAYLSNAAVERSKQRIQRLPFIEKVEVETNPVPGAADLVDVDFEIEEGLPGQFGGGIGYSESQSVILNGNFVHSNFMGTGNRVAAEINSGALCQGVQLLAHRSLHDDRRRAAHDLARLSRHHAVHLGDFGLRHRDDHARRSTTTIRSPSIQYLGFGVSAQRAELVATEGGSADAGCRLGAGTTATPRSRASSSSSTATATIRSSTNSYSSKFDTYELNVGLALRLAQPRDLRRPRRASSFQCRLHVAGQRRRVLDRALRLPAVRADLARLHADVQPRAAYGKALGDTTALPPYRQYFAGGPDSVRGFRESRLGPKDNFGRPYGGNIKTVAQTELLLPMPEKWRNSARFSLFFDIGNVFSDQDIDFRGPTRMTR